MPINLRYALLDVDEEHDHENHVKLHLARQRPAPDGAHIVRMEKVLNVKEISGPMSGKFWLVIFYVDNQFLE